MNKPYRWGILGTADISRRIIRAVRAIDNCELRAVASRSEQRARAWAAEHDIPLAFSSYDALLRSGEIDFLYNPLPNSLHAEWTIKALEAGLPVLCEKPLAVDAAEARTIARVAERTGLHVAEAFMYRFHPQWERALDLLRDGAVGEVVCLDSVFTFRLDDPAANPASAALAGGALRDVGCYCVNFARLVVGAEPLRACAFAHYGAVDERLVGLLEFPGGLLARFATGLDAFERHGAEIIGSTGSLRLTHPWVPGDEPGRLLLSRENRPPAEILVPPADSYRLEIEDFVAVAAAGARPRWPLADAVANAVVLDALDASAREKRVVLLP